MGLNKKIFSLSGISFRNYLSIISTIFLSSLLLFATIVYYNLLSNFMMNKIEKIEQSNLRQLNNKIESSFNEMARLAVNLSKSDVILNDIRDIKSNSSSVNKYLDIQNRAIAHIVEMQIPFEDVSFIGIYINEFFFTSNGNILTLSTPHADSEIFKAIKATNENMVFIDSSKNMPANREFVNLYSNMLKVEFNGFAYATITNEDRNISAVVFIVMKPEWILKLVAQDQNLMITNSSNSSILYNSNPVYKEILKDFTGFAANNYGFSLKKIQKTEYHVFYLKSKYCNTYVFRDIKSINRQLDNIKMIIVFTLCICVVVVLLLTRILSRYIVRPVSKLVSSYNKTIVTEDINHTSGKRGRFTFRDSILFYLISISVVSILVLNVVLYNYSTRLINESVTNIITTTFKQTIYIIDNFFTINEKISKSILMNKLVQDFLTEDMNYNNSDSKLSVIRKVIDENISLSNVVFNADLYKTDGTLIFSTLKNTTTQDADKVLLEFMDKYSTSVWTFSNKDNYGRNYLKLVLKIKGVQKNEYNFKNIGYLVLTYYERDLQDLYSDIDFGEGSDIFIVDKKGIIISNKLKGTIGTNMEFFKDNSKANTTGDVLLKEKDYLYINLPCSKIPLYLTGKVPNNYFSNDIKQVFVWNIYILILGILIASILSYIIAFRVTKPIDKLRDLLLLSNENNTGLDINIKTTINEIDELSSIYNKMIYEIRDLIKKVYISEIKEKKLEKEKNEAELIALQAQIDPHFLYNTLESIKWMVKNEQKNKAVNMINSLGDLFRLGISRENNLITIREEIDYAKSYVDIMNNRVKDNILFNFKINEDIYGYLTLKLTLQPIIENAISHGMKGKLGHGIVNILGYAEGEQIIFKVADNGIGIKKELLDEIKTSLSNELPGKSIGIFNVQKRIQLYFGKEYGLSIESMPGMGTIVKLVIPKVVMKLSD